MTFPNDSTIYKVQELQTGLVVSENLVSVSKNAVYSDPLYQAGSSQETLPMIIPNSQGYNEGKAHVRRAERPNGKLRHPRG